MTQSNNVTAARPENESPAGESGTARGSAEHSLGLGALRGIAALAVVIYHVFLVLPVYGIDRPHVLELDLTQERLLVVHLFLGVFNGRGMVTLFFVLSGCVLALSLDRTSTFGWRDLPGYWVRRGFRLYPLLIFAATAGLLLQLTITPNVPINASSWANWHYNVPYSELPKAWLRNAIGIDSSLNSPAWSIEVELTASFLFPALYVLSLRRGVAALTAMLLIALMILYPGPTFANIHLYLFSFFAGALVPRYARPAVDLWLRLDGWTRRATAVVVVLCFMFGRRLIEPSELAPEVIITETFAGIAIVAWALFAPTPALFRSPVAQWLGRISYGVYLLHLIVLFALTYQLWPIFPSGHPGARALATTLLCAATLAVTLPLATVIHALLEQPLQRVGSRLARKLNPRREHTVSEVLYPRPMPVDSKLP